MQEKIVVIETGRPMANFRGGGSVNSMLVLARHYSNQAKLVHLVLRHYTVIDTEQLPKGVKIDYLNRFDTSVEASAFVKRSTKSILGRKSNEFFGTLVNLKETYTIFQLLKRDKNIIAIHLNNRLLPNTHLIWLKLFLKVKLFQHQRQYDTYLPYPTCVYNKLIDEVFCVSKDIQLSTQKLGIKKTKLLYNSCIEHLGQALYDTEIVKYNFLWIGRIVHWKGLHEITRTLDGINAKIHIYGSYDESNNYAAESFDILNKNGIDYEYHGYVPSSVIFSKNYKNTFLLHSSIKPEPFGRVIIEAMSIGLIPISFGCGGSRELIDDHINGIIIDPQKPLRTYIRESQYRWPEMGEKAKHKFNTMYCNKVHCAQLNEFLCAE